MAILTKLPNEVFVVEHKGKELPILQLSDVHFDSMKCDRELLTKHLKQAEKKKAFVFINGDFFDVMQGKYDPRRTYEGIRPEYVGGNYLDLVLEDAVKYLSKFDLTYFIGEGNHESNIRERMSTDLIDRLIMGLKHEGVNCERGKYKGWIIYRMKYTGKCVVIKQHFHHGSGGNAPRSKGILNADINIKKYPDADILTRGHDHNKWYLPQVVERLKGRFPNFRREKRKVHVLQTGSYKKLGDAGWAVEKGFSEPVLGGWWTTIKVDNSNHKKITYEVEVIEAQ
jgi:hypothetical protein